MKKTGVTSIASNSLSPNWPRASPHAGKKDSARKVLEHYDQNVLESNFPYGMTSNQGNMHDYFLLPLPGGLLCCRRLDPGKKGRCLA